MLWLVAACGLAFGLLIGMILKTLDQLTRRVDRLEKDEMR